MHSHFISNFSRQEVPDPIKLVRRLTALEIALGNLKNDCEFISRKRTEIVKSVMETQLENVTQVQEVNWRSAKRPSMKLISRFSIFAE